MTLQQRLAAAARARVVDPLPSLHRSVERGAGIETRELVHPGRVTRKLFVVAASAFLILLVVTIVVTAVWGERPFSYAVDDAYIHLTMAHNLAYHGTWGIVPGTFESASSSPAWTAALAAGVRIWPLPEDWLPLVLNIAAAMWLLWMVVSLLPDLPLTRRQRVIAAAVTPLVLGLVPLVVTGMEHTVHAAITVQLFILLWRRTERSWSRSDARLWYGLLAIGVLVRMETLFIAVGAAAAVLVLERARASTSQRARFAVGSIAAASLPVAAVAVIQLAEGAYPLSNSITAKSNLASGSLVQLNTLTDNLSTNPIVGLLFVLCSVVAFVVGRSAEPWRAVPAATTALVLAELALFGDVGIFSRYEAFVYIGAIVVLGLYLATGDFAAGERRARLVALLAIVVVAPRIALLWLTPLAMNNISTQRVAMGEFLARYYDGRGVAVNDIGAVGYQHRGDLLDLEGLGSIDVLRARKDGDLDSAFLAKEFAEHDTAVVAVFAPWYEGVLPQDLVPVGRWCLTGQVLVNADRCVTFFAPNAGAVDQLRANLEDFRDDLPADETLEFLR